MKKSILILSMLAIVFASCKKDKDEAITPTQENLTGSYKIFTVTDGGVNVFNNSDDNLNDYEACERDDVYTLNANLTSGTTDAGTICNPPTNYSGTWSLVNSTTISFDGFPSTIKSWNGKILVLENNSSGSLYVTTLLKQ